MADMDILDSVPTSGFRCAIPNPKRYAKTNRWDLTDLANAAHQGDIQLLESLLATGDENNLFNGDLNQHFSDRTALQLAVQSGHTECVELMLKAKADPHLRERMPRGQDPEDGRTALELAKEHGWDDLTAILEKAEKAYAFGWYMPAGATNNTKVYDCWEWGKKPEKNWYMKRPGAARREGLDPKRYGVEEYEPEESLTLGPAVSIVAPVKPIPVGLLFPGQGSQYVKMLSQMLDVPAVKELIKTANAIMGFDLVEICLGGPEDRLEQTDVCQPAMFLAGMAALEKLRSQREEAVTRCQAVAGLSLGEYTALCAAGVFSFEDGMQLVKLRGEVMGRAASRSSQAMVSVAGLEKPKLAELCQQAERKEGGAAICRIANELFPKGFSCAGTTKAITIVRDLATEAGALQAKILKTSGAFHTELMQPAAVELGRALDEALPRMSPPRCAVYMNVTAQPIKAGTHPREVVALLKRQLTSSVRWEECMRACIKDGVTEFYEVGPMKQLKAMMKRIDNKVWNSTLSVEV